MLVDAHAHYKSPEELSERSAIRTVFCGTTPVTAGKAVALAEDGRVLVSCGLHPWYADQYTVEDMLPYIRKSVALGEIGLDSVWTDADIDRQREALISQLELAEQLSLPVVLHTKGMEQEIARIISRYAVRKLVHWYSCSDHLDAYLAQDCYFTIGPDLDTQPAVQNVLHRVPLDRVLTETDGLSAVEWALGRPAAPKDIPRVLERELEAIADTHAISRRRAEATVEENLHRFLYG